MQRKENGDYEDSSGGRWRSGGLVSGISDPGEGPEALG